MFHFVTILLTTMYRHYITAPVNYSLFLLQIYEKFIYNRKTKIGKIKLKLPREPFQDLFEEIDIQNKNCFDKLNRDIRGHNPLKNTRKRVHVQYSNISKK